MIRKIVSELKKNPPSPSFLNAIQFNYSLTNKPFSRTKNLRWNLVALPVTLFSPALDINPVVEGGMPSVAAAGAASLATAASAVSASLRSFASFSAAIFFSSAAASASAFSFASSASLTLSSASFNSSSLAAASASLR